MTNDTPSNTPHSNNQQIDEILVNFLLNSLPLNQKIKITPNFVEAHTQITKLIIEARINEVESFKRALDHSEINFEFEDARETLIVRNAVKAAWGVMKPQLEEQCDERITQLKSTTLLEGEK